MAWKIDTLLLFIILIGESDARVCEFPAIFNFGDSNSDTGALSATFGRIPPPNGHTFFGQPSGRLCDGRLIVDFLAEKLGLPYLDAYLNSVGTSFRHGANFAVAGATIEPTTGFMFDSGFNPLSLKVQLSQFDQFKTRTMDLYRKGERYDFPRPEDFSKALYTIDIGHNDLHFKLTSVTLEKVFEYIPDLINQTSHAIERLYENGARRFWIHNTGPLGCLPFFLYLFPPTPNNTDEVGCINFVNEVAQEFNKQLSVLISELQNKLENAAFTLVDIYSAKYALFKDAASLGLVDPHGCCCEHISDPNLRCWNVKIVNGTSIYATSCDNPREYISWDGIHFTEAANQRVVNQIFLSHAPLSDVCNLPVASQ